MPLASRIFEFVGIDKLDKNSTKPSPDLNLIYKFNRLKPSQDLCEASLNWRTQSVQ